MPCQLINGAIICGPRRRRQRCFYCGKPSDWLCDYPVPDKSCDRPICADHRINQAWEVDWCIAHVPAEESKEVPEKPPTA